jgi:hypothetical protein
VIDPSISPPVSRGSSHLDISRSAYLRFQARQSWRPLK